MSTRTASDQEIVQQIVRGERPLADLELVGMELHLEENQCRVDNPRKVSALVNAQDLARGFLSHTSDKRALREWALFLQAADLDLDVEQHPEGETILHALWDATFLNPIGENVVRMLTDLAGKTKWAS